MKSTRKFAVVSILVAVMFMFAVPSFAGHHNTEVDNNITSGNASADASVNDVNAVAGNNLTINYPAQKDVTTTRIDAKGYRGFAESANIPIPGTPGYFGTAIPGSSFQSIKTGLMYKDVFSVDELEKMAKDATISGKWGSKVIITPLVDEVANEDKADFVKVLLTKPGETLEVTLLGYITVRATSKDTVSMEVLAEAALAARDLGADVIHVTAEGANRQLKAFGWGVGLSYTRASISDSETSGGISGGGTGISGGSSGYVDLPWFQIFALKVK